MKADDFIELSNKTDTLNELVGLYESHIRDFGFENFVCSLINDSFPKRQKYPAILGNYPPDWIEYYRANHYIDYDPVFERGKLTNDLFSWSSEDNKTLTPLQRKINAERLNAGIRNGYSMFIHGSLGSMISMTVANAAEDISADKDIVSTLYVTMHQFNRRCMDFIAKNYYSANTVRISPREREVLLWCSRGKSNSEISSIIGISPKTVDYYFAMIFKKLEVNSRILAVLKAISMHLIVP